MDSRMVGISHCVVYYVFVCCVVATFGFLPIQPSLPILHQNIRSGGLCLSDSGRYTFRSCLWADTSTVNGEVETINNVSDHSATSKTSLTITTDSSFSIETANTGPNGSPVHTLTFHSIPGQDTAIAPTILQTGKIGRLTAGAVELIRGDTVLYSTAAYDDEAKDVDFLPLSVEHQERFSSAGMTSGSFHKRDGRPAEHEILTCRLIDRPIRPLIMAGWRHETQLLSWVLSYDGERSCDPLAIVASAAALYISDIPLSKPVAAVLVGMTPDGTFVVNPTDEIMETSRLNLILAGTADAVLMIEGEADFLPERTFIDAVQFGHTAVITICQGIQALGEAVGLPKRVDTIQPPIPGLKERVNEVMTERVDAMYAVVGNKKYKGTFMGALYDDVVNDVQDEFPNATKTDLHGALKSLLCQRMFVRAKELGIRGDGRKMNEIRPLTMETGLLPRVHGSALFTRGETQALATATLGDNGMRQKIDKISGLEEKTVLSTIYVSTKLCW